MNFILIVVLIIVLPLLIAATSFTRLYMLKVYNKKLPYYKVFCTVTISLYLIFFGDYHVSKLVFNHYCNDEFVGQFIHEKIGLSDGFFLNPPDSPEEELQHDFTLFINDRADLINERKFNELYEYEQYNRTELFPIGPIYITETSVTRKSDIKLLGKAVSLTNKKGWLHELDLLWMNAGDKCPKYRTSQGVNVVNADHNTLISNVFYRKL